jgi:hypothetical protein
LHVNTCGFFYDDSRITVPMQLKSAMCLVKILFIRATFRVYNWRNFLPTSYNVKVWSVMRKDDAIEGLGGVMCAVSAISLYQRQHQKKPIEHQ